MRSPRLILAGSAGLLISAAPLRAQAARGDVLLRAGQLAAAESAYYASSDARPRDPTARAALGRFLAARGAVRVGSVLLEEARKFGGDPAAIARDLAPLYRRLDDYHALVALPASPLTRPERAQAQWLVSHAPSVALPDSAVVALRPTAAVVSLGRIDLGIGGVSLQSEIDPRGAGITVDEAWRSHAAAVFGGSRANARLGALSTVHIGDLELHNVPVRFAALGGRNRAIVGIDVLARFAPAADPRAGRLVLRSSGDLPENMPGERLPTLSDDQGTRVLLDGHWVPLTDPSLRERLRTSGWALDAFRGQLVLP